MDKDQQLERLHRLERELEELKAEIAPPAVRWRFLRPAQRLGGVITNYWVLFSVLIALVTALYVQYRFQIDPWEEYRNIAANRDISRLYQKLGDRMLANTEWQAAEDAYRAALEVNPNNIEATNGIVKAQVLQPMSDEQFFVPEIVETRLEVLEREFPDDYQVLFLKGTYYLLMEDYPNASLWLQKAIEKEPEFAGSYLHLGIVEQRNFNIDRAIELTQIAREKDPNDNASAHNNLGFYKMLKQDYGAAKWHLEQADRLSRSLLTVINLGDANLFSKDYTEALRLHTFAYNQLNTPGIENERYVRGSYYYTSMPLTKDENPPIKYSLRVDDLSQKKALLLYRLSFDKALNKYFNVADIDFKNAHDLDTSRILNQYFVNHITSIINLLELEGDERDWFEKHRQMLVSEIN